MNKFILYTGSLLFVFLTARGLLLAQSQDHDKPNIVYILADDLGYGELGAYGQEKIESPNLDALAESGMKFTEHYSGSAVCAPARYMLMTGKHPGNAYIRRNDSWASRGDVGSFQAMFDNPNLEGNRPIPASTITVAEVLKEAGYTTGGFGKWGLGGPVMGGHPNDHGFDLFYGYLCQRQAHTYYPSHLWKNDQRILLANDLIHPHQDLPEDVDPYDPESYARFHDQPDYSAELIGIEALRFIDENQNTPFFLYLPTTIPHASVQAPQRWVDYYLEKFGDEEPYVSGSYVPVRYPRATYAGMISYLDEQIGEIVDKLKELGLYENTLIMFSSDNGPQHCCGVDPEYFDSAAPFKSTSGRVKGSLNEGGIRMPMIASWEGVIPAGSTTDHLSAFWDVLPTLADVAGVAPPVDIDGISFLPVLRGNDRQQGQHDYLYWEYPASGGQQAVRMGKWKGLRKNIMSEGNLEIELYNLDEDIREEHNIARQHPDITDKIREIMQTARTAPRLDQHKIQALGD